MHKLAGLWLLIATGIAWPCGNEVAPLEDLPLRKLLVAERKFELGDYRGVLREFFGYGWPSATRYQRRYRLMASLARFRVSAGEVQELGERGRAAFQACGKQLGPRWKADALAALDRLAEHRVLPDLRGRRALVHALDGVRDLCQEAGRVQEEISTTFHLVDDWVSSLRDDRRRDKDPGLAAILAEGMALLPGEGDAALKILSDLEGRDLSLDAWGLATLARLRLDRGDLNGAAGATQRCRRMARDAAICPKVPVG